MLSVSPETTCSAEMKFIAPEPRTGPARRSSHNPRPDRDLEAIGQLIARLGEQQLKTVAFRDGPDGKPLKSRFVFVRVWGGHDWRASDPGRRGAAACAA